MRIKALKLTTTTDEMKTIHSNIARSMIKPCARNGFENRLSNLFNHKIGKPFVRTACQSVRHYPFYLSVRTAKQTVRTANQTVQIIYSPVRTVCPSVRNFYSSVRTADQTVQIIYSPVRTVRQKYYLSQDLLTVSISLEVKWLTSWLWLTTETISEAAALD